MQQIKLDLERWKNIQLSMIGRIAAMKMNVLPKLLFLFQTIPIKLEKKFFDELNRIILKYIWQGKKARIKLKMLEDAKSNGGFGRPDWELYYQVSVLTWIKEWVNLK
uniref:Reverse transcriptase domain-containing protein n=1 Tax=Micrurus lemniscatus lemniscatus TaxID=129467 RepID=A0A2D4IS05_MICLE